MCGILAAWKPNGLVIDPPLFERALALQAHRGPDNVGHQRFADAWLGHNRLAIIDLSAAGNQPLTIDAKRYWITYNGEIFNYLELRTELEALGERFDTQSDTEVVLRAYQRWGTDCFARFNGMWALVIWDNERQEMLVSRDRFGIKPLYYTVCHGATYFASEIKPLLALSQKSPVPNLFSIGEFFESGLVDGLSETWFEGIYRFPIHSWARLSRQSNAFVPQSYWDLPQKEDLSWGEVKDDFFQTLDNAIKLSLRSDVPVGICLSGGVDSSAITVAASHVQNVDTFSCRHMDKEADEYSFVESLRETISFTPYDVFPESATVWEDIPKILWHLEEPAKATGVISQWTVIRTARKRVKVLLDGQGGDEVFGGYAHHFPYLFRDLMRKGRLVRAAQEIRGVGQSKFWETVLRPQLSELYQRAKARAGTGLSHPLWGPALKSHGSVLRDQRNVTFHEQLRREVEREMLPSMLRYEDKISMAFSLESRVPLLDHRLVECAFRLNESDLFHRGYSKIPLREYLSAHGANKVAWRKDKKGFPTPANAYLLAKRQSLEDLLQTGSLVKNQILRPDAIPAILSMAEADSHHRLLWHVLQSELWFRNFIDGNLNAPLEGL